MVEVASRVMKVVSLVCMGGGSVRVTLWREGFEAERSEFDLTEAEAEKLRYGQIIHVELLVREEG